MHKDRQIKRVNSEDDLSTLKTATSTKKVSSKNVNLSGKKLNTTTFEKGDELLPRDEENKYENLVDLPMKHRFLNLIVQQLRFDKEIEAIKESLFCYE